jgi:AbrB family looped-hinge helix DNA binding protein
MSEKILDVGAVTTKFQITLTQAVRDRFNFKVGDRVLFLEKDGELIVRKT